MDDVDGCAEIAMAHHRSMGGWPGFMGPWANPEDIWPTSYPVGRGQRRTVYGWTCPGCGRGYAPQVRECGHCPEGAHGKTDVPVMGEWDDDA